MSLSEKKRIAAQQTEAVALTEKLEDDAGAGSDQADDVSSDGSKESNAECCDN